MSDKAKRNQYHSLKAQIIKISRSPNSITTIQEINKYNSMVIGSHNYYKIATHIQLSVKKNSFWLGKVMYNRFPKSKNTKGRSNCNGYTQIGEYKGHDLGLKPYLKSKQMRYLMKRPIIPLGYIRNKKPFCKCKKINQYTVEGRELIHSNLKAVTESELSYLRGNLPNDERVDIEWLDNRISRYIAQKGKCAVTGLELLTHEWHCHHKMMWSKTHDNSYQNLILILADVHKLVHATVNETIERYLKILNLNTVQLSKLNVLRQLVGNPEI